MATMVGNDGRCRYSGGIPPAASVAGCEARFGGPLRFGDLHRLPARRLVDLSVGVGEHSGKLACPQGRLSDLLEERWLQRSASALRRVRVDDPHDQAELALHDGNRLLEVRSE